MDLEAGNVRLEGHIDVPEDRLSAVREALEDHISLTRKEQGCIFFNVDPCPDVPGRFLVSEAFVDAAAFYAHQTRAAKSAWADASDGLERNYETWTIT